MKALFFDGKLSLKNIPEPEIPPGEALIKVSAAGICATDREIAAGYMNFRGVPGHEFVGVVEEAEAGEWIGKRVGGEINAGCGVCDYCRRGLARHCLDRTVLGIQGRNGVFAEYTALPVENLLVIPDSLQDMTAVFIEPLAAAMEICEQVKIDPSYETLIIGDGKLSALTAQVLKLSGMRILVAGKIPEKLALFAKWGLETTLDAPPRAAFDIVVEASGRPEGWEAAVAAVKPRGTIVLKSAYHGSIDFNPALLVVNEVTLVGSRCGRFKPALRMLESGQIETEPLISRVFPFDEIIEAFNFANQPQTMKTLVEFPR